ncbi:MAG: CoA pyrophosphatase [Atopobiaceae bacterium]|nr:CoA pyrophosphatase [Atopobiaceae bacterium]
MNLTDVRRALQTADAPAPRDAAVLIPLVDGPQGPRIVLEVRAATLAVQPGEVCLPGGGVERGETPACAAVRETCEELLVEPAQIEVIGSLGRLPGPGGRALHAFVGILSDYGGTWSPDEVERTFTVDLDWLCAQEPAIYDVTLTPTYPEDYPWELVPGGTSYAWRAQHSNVPFYRGTDPLIWGATARVLMRFAEVCRVGGARG